MLVAEQQLYSCEQQLDLAAVLAPRDGTEQQLEPVDSDSLASCFVSEEQQLLDETQQPNAASGQPIR